MMGACYRWKRDSSFPPQNHARQKWAHDLRGAFLNTANSEGKQTMIRHIILLLCGLLLAAPAHAAKQSALRYFEGELLIEQVDGNEGCQRKVGKSKAVQISWQETRAGGNNRISGWMVVTGGAPGKLDGTQPAQLTVTSNYYTAHLNTPISLSLEIADGKATGILRETPAKLSFEENVCFWKQARLTLIEKTGEIKVSQRMREHAAWYKASHHESRGDHHVRYNNFAEAAAAHDQAVAELEGILPETHPYLSSLLIYASKLYAKIDDYERAAQRYQRALDIAVRHSKLGADDPAFYRGWVVLASYLYLTGHKDKAIPVIERAARLEDKAKEVDLTQRLWRMRLQGNIYIAAKQFDKAQAVLQDAVNVATAEVGADDVRTFEARAHLLTVLKKMKDNARFEAAFEPLAKEITSRFGESHKLARESNEILGMHYYRGGDGAKARPWLESAFRGYHAQFNDATQTVIDNDDARSVLSTLLDIYIKQGIVEKDFLNRVSAGKASLDDLPFHAESDGKKLPIGRYVPLNWDKLLQQ
jgi:tetratricopeptide (TPR) repeat protein